jgi:hypothetical protein
LLLIHPLLVCEAQGFELVDPQHHLFELGERDA